MARCRDQRAGLEYFENLKPSPESHQLLVTQPRRVYVCMYSRPSPLLPSSHVITRYDNPLCTETYFGLGCEPFPRLRVV